MSLSLADFHAVMGVGVERRARGYRIYDRMSLIYRDGFEDGACAMIDLISVEMARVVSPEQLLEAMLVLREQILQQPSAL